MFFFLLDKISSYHQRIQTSATHCIRFYNWEQQQSQGSCKNYAQLYKVKNLLLASWSLKTQTNYNSYNRKLLKYWTKKGISDPYMASYNQAMSFLSNMFYEEKGKYSAIAVARSAHSAILPNINGQTFWKDDRVCRVIKRNLNFIQVY